MAGTFEVSKRGNGEFQFNLKAGNGQVILSSEGYKAKESCLNGIESVRKNAGSDANFERLDPATGANTSCSRPATARSSARARCMPTPAAATTASAR